MFGGVNNFKVTLLGIHTNIEGGIPITNQITNGSFEDGETGWLTDSQGVITDSKSASGNHSLWFPNKNGWWRQPLSIGKQDKEYIGVAFLSPVTKGPFAVIVDSSGNGLSSQAVSKSSNMFQLATSYTFVADSNSKFFQVGVCSTCLKGDIYIDNIIVINLTQTFGSGNEPSKEEMDALGWFDGTASIASKTGNSQVDFNVSAETGYTISNRITCNSGYTTFENGILSVKGMNQDTVCRIVSTQ